MRTKLKSIYHKHFPEIITAVLLGLITNTMLLVYGISIAKKQREKLINTTEEIKTEQSKENIKARKERDSIFKVKSAVIQEYINK